MHKIYYDLLTYIWILIQPFPINFQNIFLHNLNYNKMNLQTQTTDSWTVYYKEYDNGPVYSEVTTDPDGTVIRLTAAGNIVIEIVNTGYNG